MLIRAGFEGDSMCNLYANTAGLDSMRQVFEVEPDRNRLGNAEPQAAIFPRGEAPVVRIGPDGRELVRMHWGFPMPQKSKKTGEPILPKAINNARDDKLAGSPFWQDSYRERRCLVPATAFCEAKGRKPATYFWFGVGEERAPFAFAGLWRSWKGMYRGELVEIDAHTIVTTKPNALVADVHPDRMPVILHPEDYEQWMTAPPDEASALLKPFPAERMAILASGEGLKSLPD